MSSAVIVISQGQQQVGELHASATCLPSGAVNVEIICTAAYSVSTRVNVNLKTDEVTVMNS